MRLVVCTNQRLGARQRSCAGSGSRALLDQLRTMIASAGLEVAVVEQVCLGKCEQGPAMRIAPGGRFFTEVDEVMLPDILQAIRLASEPGLSVDPHRQS